MLYVLSPVTASSEDADASMARSTPRLVLWTSVAHGDSSWTLGGPEDHTEDIETKNNKTTGQGALGCMHLF